MMIMKFMVLFHIWYQKFCEEKKYTIGKIPFCDQNNDVELKNFYFPIIKNTPKGYKYFLRFR